MHPRMQSRYKEEIYNTDTGYTVRARHHKRTNCGDPSISMVLVYQPEGLIMKRLERVDYIRGEEGPYSDTSTRLLYSQGHHTTA